MVCNHVIFGDDGRPYYGLQAHFIVEKRGVIVGGRINIEIVWNTEIL